MIFHIPTLEINKTEQDSFFSLTLNPQHFFSVIEFYIGLFFLQQLFCF